MSKISDLIKHLESIRESKGDLEILFPDESESLWKPDVTQFFNVKECIEENGDIFEKDAYIDLAFLPGEEIPDDLPVKEYVVVW